VHLILRAVALRSHTVLIGLLFVFSCSRKPPAESFSGRLQTLPTELMGEMQGMPAHWSVRGKGGAVSTANSLATAAGIAILRQGGNAIDALLAAQWVLAVVEPQSSGLGGGGFLLYYDAKTKKAYALDGREEAPSRIPENTFQNAQGNALPVSERIQGARAVGVPGTVALLHYAKARFGSNKVTTRDTYRRAIELAENGIRVPVRLAQAMRTTQERLVRQNGSASPYLRDGKAYAVGEIFYQRELAATLKILSDEGAAAFYRGAIGKDIIAAVQHARDYPSLMTLDDLAAYRAVERAVENLHLNGATIFSVGAPASGKAVLEAIGQTKLVTTRLPTDGILESLRAQRAAMLKRETYLEDPDFAATHARSNAGEEAQNTTHVAIIDRDGNSVSYTSSVETSMGSALVVKGRGFLLNNQLSDFNPEKGKINSVKSGRRERRTALNSEAKETWGAKRPKSSMSPLILIMANGTSVALGSPGGPTIVGTNALTATRILMGDDLQEALNKPRALAMPNGIILAELPLKRDLMFLKTLERAALTVATERRVISLGAVQAVAYDERTQTFTAASDLRREGVGLVVEPVVELLRSEQKP